MPNFPEKLADLEKKYDAQFAIVFDAIRQIDDTSCAEEEADRVQGARKKMND
ncbi:MAG: hypothetical protein M0C28_16935 [Candidatus Moduliflexus flocculans]|nr:hypothetical protein [Candidatus Moduliflexus flocculans]